jgi:hypothetical protein
MAKPPKKPKDPAKPTRAKASRPDSAPTPDTLADLLNPGIKRGSAGMGSGTGIQPPPDNSFDRRRQFSEAHTARKSTQESNKGFGEAPQRNYAASPITGLDPALEKELGLGDDALFSSPRLRGEGGEDRRSEPGEGYLANSERPPHPPRFAGHPLPQGERVTECAARMTTILKSTTVR